MQNLPENVPFRICPKEARTDSYRWVRWKLTLCCFFLLCHYFFQCAPFLGEKPFGCDKCSSRFFARETLNRHQKVHENALGDLLYGSVHSCQTCNRDFSKRGDLDKHLNLIHNHRFETSSDPKNSGLQSKRFKHAAKTYTRKRAVKIESSISIKNEPLFGDEK